MNTITVTDNAGHSHPVIAAKRIDSFRVLVVRDWVSSYNPYVVHTFNEQDGGFHHGHYCETLERAMEVFDAKLHTASVEAYRAEVAQAKADNPHYFADADGKGHAAGMFCAP